MRCASPPDSDAAAAVQGQVVETDVEQEGEARADLLAHLGRDLRARPDQLHLVEVARRRAHGHAGDVVDRLAGHEHRARLRAQSRAAAALARDGAEVGLVLGAGALGAGLAVAPLQLGQHALVLHRPRAGAVPPVPLDLHPVAAGAVQDRVLLLRGQPLPRPVEVDVVVLGQRLDDVGGPALVLLDRVAPHGDRAVADAALCVGHHQIRIDLHALAQAVAVHAHAERRVERERLRRQLREADPAPRDRRCPASRRAACAPPRPPRPACPLPRAARSRPSR